MAEDQNKKRFLQGLLGTEDYDSTAIRGLLGIAAGALQPGVTSTGQAVGAGLAGGLGQIDVARQQQAAAKNAQLESKFKQAQMAKMAQDMNSPILAPPGTQLRDRKDPRQVIGTVPTKPHKPPAPPEIIRLLDALEQMPEGDPRRPVIEELINKLKTIRPQSGTTINFNQTDSKLYEQNESKIENARSRLENADLMMSLLDGGLSTNKLAPLTTDVSGVVESIFGVRLAEDAPAAEVFRAVSNQSALRLRNPASGLGLTGNTSDRDVRFLKESVAGLGNTKEANYILLIVERAKARRQMELGDAKAEHMDTNKGLRGWSKVRKEYIEKSSLFTDEEKQRIVQLAQTGKKPGPDTDPLGLR